MNGKYDILWKGMLEEVFEDLLRFVDPEIDEELDLTRRVEFLDKELAEMYPEPGKKSGTRVVDKLAKVFRRDGGESWMLLHVEVQGKNEKGFSERMHRYYYRILERYNQDVAAIAILTGRDGKNVTGKYERRVLWGRMLYEYKTLCIADHDDEILAASNNPFAVVMLVAREALIKTKKGKVRHEDLDEELLKRKLLIVKLLQRKTFGENKVRAILVFLKNYVLFRKPETNRSFVRQVDRINQKTETMGIIEQWAEIKAAEAREEERQNTSRLFVENLLKGSDFSLAKIASLANVSLYFVRKVQKQLRVK